MSKLAFYFSIYKDELWAVRLVHQIKHFYPKADIVCIFDGQGFPGQAEKIADLGANVRVGERLKGPGNGMKFSHRNLSVALEYSDAELFFKMDPDSYIWRRFNDVPENVEFFGQAHSKPIGQAFPKGVTYCHGACWGIRRSLMQRMVDSEIFYDKLYEHPHNLYNRYANEKFRKIGDRGDAEDIVMHEDFIFGDAATKLGAKPVRWKDVRLHQAQELVQDPNDLVWSVTHPTRSIW